MATVQDIMLQVAQRISPTTKSGQRIQASGSAISISTTSNASPIVVTTATAHGLETGQKAFLKDVATDTVANNTTGNPAWTVTKLSSTTFSLDGSSAGGGGTGGTVVGALVGSVDTAQFTRQRLLDIYNQSRQILAHVLFQLLPPAQASAKIGGLSVRNTTLSFTSGSATKPTGYVKGFSLTDSSNGRISIIPASDYEHMRELESATNRFVLDVGTTFVAPSGTTYIGNGSTYILIYSGVTTFTLSDVIHFSGTQVSDPIDVDWIPILVEAASRLAAGMGIPEVQNVLTGMAKEMVGA